MYFFFCRKTKKNKQKSKNAMIYIYIIGGIAAYRKTWLLCLLSMFLFVQLLVQEKGQVQEETQPTLPERRGHVLTQQLKAYVHTSTKLP